MDDDTGWTRWFLAVWSPEVCAAVVARLEAATAGHRGWLARALLTPERADPAWIETAHALVLAAIRDETGADLDAMGSQAAWEAYEQVWDALRDAWAAGGPFVAVRLGSEVDATRLLQSLPAEAAAHLGADVTVSPSDPLWLSGRLRIDRDGLAAYRRLDGGQLPTRIARDLAALERLLEA